MGGKSKAPAPPDYSQIAAASEKAAKISYRLGKEQLAWAKEQYAKDSKITAEVVDSFLESMASNQEAAEKDRARYEELYQPLEDDLIEDAKSYATDGRRDLEMGRAQANVAQQFEQARQSAQRDLESYGIDPSATRYAALDVGMRAQQAAAQAAAGNQASQMVDATSRALRSEAINVGRGYPGQVAGTYNTALQSGQGAVTNTLNQTQTGANTMGTAPQYMGLGNQSLNTWGNTLNMGYQNALQAWQAEQNQSSGWGSALGLVGGVGMKLLGFEEGGPVPEAASPSRGSRPDDVPAALSVDEFVVPEDVARWKGEEFFQKLIEQSRKAKGEAQAVPMPTAAPQPQTALPTR